jgi:hypothetical protein
MTEIPLIAVCGFFFGAGVGAGIALCAWWVARNQKDEL